MKNKTTISRQDLIEFLLRHDVVKFFGNQSLSVYCDKDKNFHVIANVSDISKLNLTQVLKFSELIKFVNLPLLEVYKFWKYDFNNLVERHIELV